MSRDPIEERLARIQPASLPNDLMAKLIAARPQPQRATQSSWLVRWIWLGGTATALGFLIAFLIAGGETQKPAGQSPVNLLATAPAHPLTRILLPVGQRNILIRADDLGIVDSDTAHPVRLIRTVWVDDSTFRSSDGQSHGRLTQPRERIIPVSLQTY